VPGNCTNLLTEPIVTIQFQICQLTEHGCPGDKQITEWRWNRLMEHKVLKTRGAFIQVIDHTFSSTNPLIQASSSVDSAFDHHHRVSLFFEMERVPILPVRSTFESHAVKTCSTLPTHLPLQKLLTPHAPMSQSYVLYALQHHLPFGNIVFEFILLSTTLPQISSSTSLTQSSWIQKKRRFESSGINGTKLANPEHPGKRSPL
jgi:hypothetical protein